MERWSQRIGGGREGDSNRSTFWIRLGQVHEARIRSEVTGVEVTRAWERKKKKEPYQTTPPPFPNLTESACPLPLLCVCVCVGRGTYIFSRSVWFILVYVHTYRVRNCHPVCLSSFSSYMTLYTLGYILFSHIRDSQ